MSVAVCFDLELDGNTILCASTVWTNGFLTVPQLWSQQTRNGFVPLNEATIDALLQSLWNWKEQGIALATWGGPGSDWRALYAAASSARKEQVKELAKYAIDIPLISAAANGMMMGLTAVAEGMGLGNRPACDSRDVPANWNSGDVRKQNDVLLHVQWDATICATLYNKLYHDAQYQRPLLTWTTVKGDSRSVRLQRSKTIAGTYALPNVDELLTWGAPIANFKIPEHLHVGAMTSWLR
jgi:hypothetical protein